MGLDSPALQRHDICYFLTYSSLMILLRVGVSIQLLQDIEKSKLTTRYRSSSCCEKTVVASQLTAFLP